MKKLSIFIILLLILGAIFYSWPKNKENNINSAVALSQNWEVSFQFSETDSNNISFSWPNQLSLAKITELISQKESWDYKFEDYDEMGILVSRIKDKKNGSDQKYWQYFIDGQQPQISADKYFPRNDAHIEWKFIKSEF